MMNANSRDFEVELAALHDSTTGTEMRVHPNASVIAATTL
jgi:hypothetical protein